MKHLRKFNEGKSDFREIRMATKKGSFRKEEIDINKFTEIEGKKLLKSDSKIYGYTDVIEDDGGDMGNESFRDEYLYLFDDPDKCLKSYFSMRRSKWDD